MSEPKDSQDDHDPDYDVPGPSDEAHQKLFEEQARTNVARNITSIVEKEFSREIDTKEKEIIDIEERLHKALKTLHFLRYVIVTDFYNRKQCQNAQGASDSRQTRIHPAIKQIIGKSPRLETNLGIPSTSRDATFVGEGFENSSIKKENELDGEVEKRLGISVDDSVRLEDTKNSAKRRRDDDNDKDEAPAKKIPRYVPPKSAIPEPQVPSRGARHKVRKRIVVGNISKWIPPDWREDTASHKWTMYVRGSKENADIADFVGKVRFFLHPSYRPNDVVEVTSSPFHLSRRGWGEFPLRVQLHFKNPMNKPMDIIHHLKLDRTYTGLQTLGSETVVDVWIKVTPDASTSIESKPIHDDVIGIKKEPKDFEISDSQINSKNNFCDDSKNFETQNCCEKIKKEPREVHENPTAYQVHLEHDYANFSHEDSSNFTNDENNVTISHSPNDDRLESNSSTSKTSSTNAQSREFETCPKKSSHEKKIYEEIVSTTKFTNLVPKNLEKFPNGKITKINDSTTSSKILREDVRENVNFSTKFEGIDSSKINPSVDVKTMISNLEDSSTKLQPLTITIPTNFEGLKKSTKTKKIILSNDDKKLITIDTTNITKIGTKRVVSLLKKPTNAIASRENVKNDGRVVFKLNPTNSLIFNATDDVPALRIVDHENLGNFSNKNYVVDEKNSKFTNNSTIDGVKSLKNSKITLDGCKIVGKPKITLGKDRIGTTSKKKMYEEILRSIDDADINDVTGLVRFVIRRLPLVSEKATDPEYRNLHPYACSSEKEFLDSNVGKQRALEWYRAKHVKTFLQKKKIPQDDQWTIKEIMLWSRLHGHTPMRSSSSMLSLRSGDSTSKSTKKNCSHENSESNICTFTEPVGLIDYLREVRQTKIPTTNDDETNDVDEIIDVENIFDDDDVKKKAKLKLEEEEKRKMIDDGKTLSLGIPKNIVGLQSYVTNTSRLIGIKLGPEEIVEGVEHCAAARTIVRALQCLMEDLLRSSLAKAWERSNDGGCPDAITLEDVRGAIISRDEFDVFTNEGLGSHHCPDD